MILSDITITERLKDDLVIMIDGKRVTEGEAIQPRGLWTATCGRSADFRGFSVLLLSPRSGERGK